MIITQGIEFISKLQTSLLLSCLSHSWKIYIIGHRTWIYVFSSSSFSKSARMDSDPRVLARRSSSTWTEDYVQFIPRVVELEIALLGCVGEEFMWVKFVISFSTYWGPLIHRHNCLFVWYDNYRKNFHYFRFQYCHSLDIIWASHGTRHFINTDLITNIFNWFVTFSLTNIS